MPSTVSKNTLPILFTILNRYVNITESEISNLIPYLEPYRLKREDYLVKKGAVSLPWVLVMEGVIRKFYIDAMGAEKNIDFFTRSDYLIGLLSNKPGDTQPTIEYSFQALTDCELLLLSEESQKKIQNSTTIPWREIERLYFREQVTKLEKQLISAHSESALERYKNFLREYSGIKDKLPQNQIASYLGITPVSLSRIRNQR